MFDRYARLRMRRRIKHQQKRLENVGSEAGKHFESHVVGRWRRFADVRRYVIGWLALVLLLITGVFLQSRELNSYYAVEVPVAGGTFREGVVGQLTNMNPIFATSSVDKSASRLMFNTLFKYDTNNRLVGSLAHKWAVNKDETVYTVHLREDVVWHDGQPFTSEDVVFTYNMVKHPDTKSFLNASWQDISIKAKDDYTVTFKLPNPFTPFPHSFTRGGIIPEHVLGDVPPAQLRSHPFNVSEPVGTGPFVFNEVAAVDEENSLLRLDKNTHYFLVSPRLDHFVLQTFSDRENMVNSFIEGELTAAAGLRTLDRDLLANRDDAVWYDLPLNNALFLFFNNSDPILKDDKVRKALTQATDQNKILEKLENRFLPARSPLLKDQLGYSEKILQLPTNVKRANKLLDKAGWKRAKNGVRKKDGKPLKLRLVTQNTDDYADVAQWLRDQYQEIGVQVEVLVVDENAIQQNHIVPHNYQILLAGITIGNDPDVFPYWHSSQSSVGGFNLSEFRNDIADTALEAGRTRSDPKLRAAKYHTFLEEWVKAAPAVALYQPGYSYVQRSNVDNFRTFPITSPDDRFTHVHTWQINTKSTNSL